MPRLFFVLSLPDRSQGSLETLLARRLLNAAPRLHFAAGSPHYVAHTTYSGRAMGMDVEPTSHAHGERSPCRLARARPLRGGGQQCRLRRKPSSTPGLP
jgi:hypothetical protein